MKYVKKIFRKVRGAWRLVVVDGKIMQNHLTMHSLCSQMELNPPKW